MVRFLHSGDWQLGMTRHFLSTDAQARYSEARLDAVRNIAELARKEDCSFVVVSGDVFESNHLDRQVVVRALDALTAFNVPVYLLPGNHDPVNAGSIYRSSTFREHCPKHVAVLESPGIVTVPDSNVELVGAPWDSKHQLEDLVAKVCAELIPSDRVVRVVVAHGAVDEGSRNPDDPTLIRVEAAEDAIRRGCVQYVALGDRHSATEVGSTGRIWYSGTPLVTDYTEVEPNEVLLVELGQKSVSVQKRLVGSWRFIRQSFDVNTRDEVEAVQSWLEDLPDKRCAVVKLGFVGTLSLTNKAELDAVIEHAKDLFAAVEAWEGHTELRVLPDEDDLRDLALSGFAKEATAELGGLASSEGPEASVAQDALGLLYRLASRQP